MCWLNFQYFPQSLFNKLDSNPIQNLSDSNINILSDSIYKMAVDPMRQIFPGDGKNNEFSMSF